MVAELEAGPSAGSALLRAALAEVADGVRSVAEADLRVLILRSDLPRPASSARYGRPSARASSARRCRSKGSRQMTSQGPAARKLPANNERDASPVVSGTPVRRLVPRPGPGSGTGSRL